MNMMMMIMNCFCGMVDQQEAFCQRSSPSPILSKIIPASIIWMFAELELRLRWIKLSSSDNHYTMTPLKGSLILNMIFNIKSLYNSNINISCIIFLFYFFYLIFKFSPKIITSCKDKYFNNKHHNDMSFNRNIWFQI